MKQLLFAIFFFSGLVAFSQVTIEVSPADTTVCFRDSVAFTPLITGTNGAKIEYQWQQNFINLTGPGANDSIFSIASVDAGSPGLYRCIITVEGLGTTTSENVTLKMRPRMYIDTIYRYNPLDCRLIKKDKAYKLNCGGQFTAHASGGTPFKNIPNYIYEWHGGQTLDDTLVTGLCPGKYILTVSDSLGCSFDTSYIVDYIKAPKVTFSVEPDTVIYLTNPSIRVEYPDSMNKYRQNFEWSFGDSVSIANINPASHTYADTTKPGLIAVRLAFTDLNGCDTVVVRDINVKVAELDIPNLFTPNGDGINEQFAIELKDDRKRDFREAYVSNELLIFDRWGKKVYHVNNYKSKDWDGERLADGTYFYILRLTGRYGDDVQKGSVTILRGE